MPTIILHHLDENGYGLGKGGPKVTLAEHEKLQTLILSNYDTLRELLRRPVASLFIKWEDGAHEAVVLVMPVKAKPDEQIKSLTLPFPIIEASDETTVH